MSRSNWWDNDVRLNLQSLIQKQVLNAYGNSDGLILETNDGYFELNPYGDCCSHCYIQHVDGSEALKDAVILEIENISLPDVLNPSDVSDVWGYRFHTTKGIFTIEMRLDHNGFYGGELEVNKFKGENLGTPLIDF